MGDVVVSGVEDELSDQPNLFLRSLRSEVWTHLTLSTHYLHYLYRYFMPPPREPSYNYGPSMLQKKSKEPFINDSTNIFILRNSFKIILIFH